MNRFLKKNSAKILYITVLVFTFLSHASYLNSGFTWLDHGDIEAGRTIIPLSDYPIMLVTRFGETGFYRPLVTFTNSLDYALYKTNATGYHLTNTLLHTAVTAVVPLFLSVFFTFTAVEMLLAMLIVGVHPLSWLEVGAITHRQELFLTLFTLLTAYFHKEARLQRRELYKVLAATCFLLALFSKETAIVIVPAIIIFWELIQKKNKLKSIKQKSQLSLYISEVIVFGIYILFRQRAVPELWRASSPPLSFSDAIGTRLSVLSRLVIDFVSPVRPPLSDAIPVVGLFTPIPMLIFIALVILVVLIIKRGIKSELGRAIILCLILLTPALNIIPVPRIGSPHYGYLPLVVFSALVILIVRFLRKSFDTHGIFILVVVGFWILVMAMSTFWGGFHFKDDYTLFQPEVLHDSHFLEGYYYLGNYYFKKQNLEAAEKEYFLALKSDPKILAYQEKRSIFINLASVYLQNNQLDKADQMLSNAEELKGTGNDLTLFHNRMILSYKKQDYKAVFQLSQDNQAFPYSPIIYIILADSLHHLGRDTEAIALLKNLLPLLNQSEQGKIQLLIKSLSVNK
jgi:hypothetical protein